MVTENIIVRIKSVAEIKELANTITNLRRLKRTGIDVSKPMKQAEKRMGQLHVTTKKAGIAFKGFQMEMLSVLFFGMAMQRFLTALIKPAFDLTGTFETLNIMLGAAFLPTAERVNESLFDMLENFNQLDAETRLWIGNLILLFAVLSAAFMLFGMFALGLQGIGTLFGVTSGAVMAFFGWLVLLAGAILWTIILFKNWEKHTRNIKYATAGTFGVLGYFAWLLGNPVGAAIFGVLGLLVLTKQAIEDYSDAWDELNKTMEVMEPFREHYKPLDDFLKILEKIIEAIKTIGRWLGLIPAEGGARIGGFEPAPVGARETATNVITVNAGTEIMANATAQDVINALDRRDESIADKLMNLIRR